MLPKRDAACEAQLNSKQNPSVPTCDWSVKQKTQIDVTDAAATGLFLSCIVLLRVGSLRQSPRVWYEIILEAVLSELKRR